MAGGGRMEFKGGTYNATAHLDVGDALKEAFKLDEALRKIGTTLSSLSKGHDLSAFWDEQTASLENVISALERFKSDMKSVDGAENLVKTLNAFAAWHPDDSITQYFDRLGAGAQDLIDKAKSMATNLDTAFSVPSLRDSIQAFEMLRDAGVDVAEVVGKLKQGDLSALTTQIANLEKESGRSAVQIKYLREQVSSFESGDRFREMSDSLEQFRESAEVAKNEFRAFLEAAGFSGSDLMEWGQFSSLFSDIETGSKTAAQAMDAVRSAYAGMFSEGATTGQLSSINSALSEMKELLTEVRGASGGNGGGGVFGGGGGSGGPGDFDDKLQQIINHLAEINSQLTQVSSTLGTLGQDDAGGLATILQSMRELVTVINELNSKDFSIQNVFQSGNAELDAANNMRAYREEAVALNNYLVTLRNSITDAGNSSRAFGRELLKMSEQFDILWDFDPEKIKKQIANAKDLGHLDSIIVQLNEYRNAMQQIVDVGKQVGVEFAMPDTTRIDEARQKVAELTNTVQQESSAVSEAATSAEQLSNALSVTERGLSSASAQELASAFETLKSTLETIRGQIDSAFDLTQQIANVQQLSDAYKSLADQVSLVNQNIASQASGGETGGATVAQIADLQRQVSDLLGQLNDALGRITSAFDLSAALGGVQSFKQEISDIIAMINTLQRDTAGATERFSSIKFDETISSQLTSVSGKFAEIGVILDGLKTKIAETFDLSKAVSDAERLTEAYSEVKGALELIKDLANAAKKQTTQTSGGGAKKSIDDTTDAIERQTQAWYDEQAAWREAQDQMARDAGWAQAEALAKREAAEQAAIDRDVAKHLKAEETKAKAAEAASARANAAWNKQISKYERNLESLQLGSSGVKFTDNADAVDKYTEALNGAKSALNNLRNSTDENRDAAIAAFNQEIESVRKLRDELNSVYGSSATGKQLESFKKQWINFTQSNSSWYNKNKSAYDEIFAKISSGAELSSGELRELQTEFLSMNNAMSIARQGGRSFFDEMKAGWKKFGGWSIVTRTFTSVIRIMKQAVSAVKEVDAAMVELRKVTRLTDQQYSDFLDSASTSSKRIGSSLSDMINATADFSRLGYTIDEATKLAEAASIYMNVGDKIESMDDATKSIISTMKAFGIEAENALTIVDKYNEVGNKYAISAAGIGEALQRSAAALSVANNSLDESIGLVVAANDVIQNPEQVGTALKTLTMYLRAAKTEAEEAGIETEGMASSVSKLRDQLLALTGNRLDIMIDEDTFKSTYQILQELSEIWDDLADVDQANILSLIGGKRNANVVTSILKNFKDAAAASETAANAAGSAWEENEKYLEGIEGKTKRLQASFQDFANSVVGSDIVKTITDVATGILNIATSLSKLHLLLPTVIALGNAIRMVRANATANSVTSQLSFLFAQGGDSQAIQQQANSIVAGLTAMERKLVASKLQMAGGSAEAQAYAASIGVASTSTNALGVSVDALKTKTYGLSGALNTLKNSASVWIMLASLIVSGIRYISDSIHQANEEAKQAARDAYDSFKSNAEQYQNRLDSLSKLGKEGSRFNELVSKIDESQEHLGLANEEYSEFIGYVDQIVSLSPSVVASYSEQGYTLKTSYVDVLNEATKSLRELHDEQERGQANSWKNSTGKSEIEEVEKAWDEYTRSLGPNGEGTTNLVWSKFLPNPATSPELAKQFANAWNDALLSIGIDPILVDVDFVPSWGSMSPDHWDEVFDWGKDKYESIEWYTQVYNNVDKIIEGLRLARDEFGEPLFTTEDLDLVYDAIVGRVTNSAGLVRKYTDQMRSDIENVQLVMKYEPSTKNIFSEIFESDYYKEFVSGMYNAFNLFDSTETKISKSTDYLNEFYNGLTDVNKALASESKDDAISALTELQAKYDGNKAVIAMIDHAIAHLNGETEDAADATEKLSRSYDKLSTAMSNASSASNLLKKLREGTESITEIIPDLEKLADAWNKLFPNEEQKVWTDFLSFGDDGNIDWGATATGVEGYIDAMVDAALADTEFGKEHSDVVEQVKKGFKEFAKAASDTFDLADAISNFNEGMSLIKNVRDGDILGSLQDILSLVKSGQWSMSDFFDASGLKSESDIIDTIVDGLIADMQELAKEQGIIWDDSWNEKLKNLAKEAKNAEFEISDAMSGISAAISFKQSSYDKDKASPIDVFKDAIDMVDDYNKAVDLGKIKGNKLTINDFITIDEDGITRNLQNVDKYIDAMIELLIIDIPEDQRENARKQIKAHYDEIKEEAEKAKFEIEDAVSGFNKAVSFKQAFIDADEEETNAEVIQDAIDMLNAYNKAVEAGAVGGDKLSLDSFITIDENGVRRNIDQLNTYIDAMVEMQTAGIVDEKTREEAKKALRDYYGGLVATTKEAEFELSDAVKGFNEAISFKQAALDVSEEDTPVKILEDAISMLDEYNKAVEAGKVAGEKLSLDSFLTIDENGMRRNVDQMSAYIDAMVDIQTSGIQDETKRNKAKASLKEYYNGLVKTTKDAVFEMSDAMSGFNEAISFKHATFDTNKDDTPVKVLQDAVSIMESYNKAVKAGKIAGDELTLDKFLTIDESGMRRNLDQMEAYVDAMIEIQTSGIVDDTERENAKAALKAYYDDLIDTTKQATFEMSDAISGFSDALSFKQSMLDAKDDESPAKVIEEAVKILESYNKAVKAGKINGEELTLDSFLTIDSNGIRRSIDQMEAYVDAMIEIQTAGISDETKREEARAALKAYYDSLIETTEEAKFEMSDAMSGFNAAISFKQSSINTDNDDTPVKILEDALNILESYNKAVKAGKIEGDELTLDSFLTVDENGMRRNLDQMDSYINAMIEIQTSGIEDLSTREDVKAALKKYYDGLIDTTKQATFEMSDAMSGFSEALSFKQSMLDAKDDESPAKVIEEAVKILESYNKAVKAGKIAGEELTLDSFLTIDSKGIRRSLDQMETYVDAMIEIQTAGISDETKRGQAKDALKEYYNGLIATVEEATFEMSDAMSAFNAAVSFKQSVLTPSETDTPVKILEDALGLLESYNKAVDANKIDGEKLKLEDFLTVDENGIRRNLDQMDAYVDAMIEIQTSGIEDLAVRNETKAALKKYYDGLIDTTKQATFEMSDAMSGFRSAISFKQSALDMREDETPDEILSDAVEMLESYNKAVKAGKISGSELTLDSFLTIDENGMRRSLEQMNAYVDAMIEIQTAGIADEEDREKAKSALKAYYDGLIETTEAATYEMSDALNSLNDVMSVLTDGFDLTDPLGAIKQAKELADEWNAARKSIGKSEDKHWTDFISPEDLLSQFGDAAQIIKDGAKQIQDSEEELKDATTEGVRVRIPVEARLIASAGISDVGFTRSDGKIDIAKLAQEFIPDDYNGNVDLTNRKIIPINILTKVGWIDYETGKPLDSDYATIYTNTFSAGDTSKGYDVEYDQNIVCNITPITPDGEVLSPDGIFDYFYDIVEEANKTGKSIMDVDAEHLGLVFKIDVVEEGKTLEEAYEDAGQWAQSLHEMQAEWDNIRFENNWFGDESIDPSGVFKQIRDDVRDGADAIDDASDSVVKAGRSMNGAIGMIASAGTSDIKFAKANIDDILNAWDGFTSSSEDTDDPLGIMSTLDGIMGATRASRTTTESLREMYSDLIDSFIESDEKLKNMTDEDKSVWRQIIMAAVDEMLESNDVKKRSQEIADSFTRIGDAYAFMQEHAAGDRIGSIAQVYDELQQLRDLTGDQKIQLSDFIEWDEDIQDYVYKANTLQDTIDDLATTTATKLVDAEIAAGHAMDEALRSEEIKKRAAEIKASLGEVADAWSQMASAVSNVKSVKSFRDSIASGEGDMLDMLSDAISLSEEFGLQLEDIVTFDALGQMVFSADALNLALDASIDKLVNEGVVARELAEQLKRAAREQQVLDSTQQRVNSSYDTWSSLSGTREYVDAQQLTYSQYQKLIDADARYASALQYSNGQLSINAQKYNEITAAIGAETIAVAKLRIEENKLQIDKLVKEYNKLEDTQSDRARSIMQEIKKLALETQGYAVLATEIDGATSAMNRFLNASSNVNDESYDAAASAFNIIRDTLYNADSEMYMMTGREQFKEAMKFVLGENVEFNDEGFEKAFKAAERYLDKGRAGLQNFVDDLFKFNIVDSNGNLNMSLEEISNKLGISKDAVASLLKQLNQLEGFDIDLSDETGDATEDVKSWFDQLTELTTTIDGFETDGINFSVSDTTQTALTALQEQLDNINTTIQSINTGLNGSAGNVQESGGDHKESITTDVTTTVTTSGAEESQAALQDVQNAADSIPEETNTTVKEEGAAGVAGSLREIISLENQASRTVVPSSSQSGLATLKVGLAEIVNRINQINSMTVQPKSGKPSMSGLWTGTMRADGGRTLVGELGQEMVVDIRNGRYYTVGTNGPEIVNIPKDAIVYNHLMTAQLLGRNTSSRVGAKNARGASRAIGDEAGRSLATGTISPVVPGANPPGSSPSTQGVEEAVESLEDILEEIKDKYDEINEDLEHLIKHLEQQFYVNERALNFDGMAGNLAAEAKKYQKIIDNCQKGIRDLLAHGADDSSKQVQELEEAMWDAYRSMYDALDQIRALYVDALNDEIDNIQSAYKNLYSALSEYNEDGKISLDTFQALLENGIQYLSLLKNENGQYDINEQSIQKLIKARKNQLAIETALAYISRIKEALQNGEVNKVNELINATESIASGTWSYVYAQAALLKAQGLSNDQYNQLIENLHNLQDLTNNVGEDFSGIGEGAAIESIKNKYEKLNEEIEHYIDHQEQARKTSERSADYVGQEEALRNKISYWQQIIENAQKALEEMNAAGATDLDKNVQEMEQTIWDATENINEAMDSIRDLLTSALSQRLKDIESAFNTMSSAVNEFNESGHISLSTFQSLIEGGVEYLSLLKKENGQYVINENAIRDMIAARKEQLAIETALSYISRIREALEKGETEKINQLADMSELISTNAWSIVYAQLAQLRALGLSQEQYEQILHNVQTLQQLAADVSFGDVDPTKEDVLGEILDKYTKLNDEIEHYIAHQQFAYSQAERALNYDGMVNSLTQQAAYYEQIMQNIQAGIEEMLAEGADDTDEALQNLEESYWAAYNSMYAALDSIRQLKVDALTSKIDDLQNAFRNLESAAKDYNEYGGITLDTFQSIVSSGLQYLTLLEEQGDQYVLSAERVREYIAAQKEHLAIETALSYISNISEALHNGEIERINSLIDATNSVSDATWDYVYAQAALLKTQGLSDEMYDALVQNLDKLRSITAGTIDDISTAEDRLSKQYDKQRDALEKILDYTEELIKAEAEDRIDAINDEIDAYKEIIDLKKKSLETSKEENEYQDEVAEKVKEIAKLQAKYDMMALDDSRSAAAERLKLQEEIAEKQKDLASYQQDYAYNAQVEALNEEADSYEKLRQGDIDDIEASISSEEKLYQLAIARIRDHWDTLYQDLIAWNTEQGNVINQEITDNWEKAAAAVQKYGSYLDAISGLDASSGGSGNIVVADRLPRYHSGGVVGNIGAINDKEVMAILKKGELVIDNDAKSGLYTAISAVEFLESLGRRIGSAIKSVGNLNPFGAFTPAFAGMATPQSQGYVTHQDVEFNASFNVAVSGVAEGSDAKRVGEQIANSAINNLYEVFNRKGISFTPKLRQG